jgi:hypothetical protein
LGIWLRAFGIWNDKKVSSKLLDIPFPPVHVQKIAPSLHGKRNTANPYLSVFWEVGTLPGCHLRGKCAIFHSNKALFTSSKPYCQSPIASECLLEDILIIPVISGSYSPIMS